MYFVYILKSVKNGKYYIGYTENLKTRLLEHNLGRVKFTKIYRPWKLFYYESLDNIKEASAREKEMKSWKSRVMIEKLKFNKIEDPRNFKSDTIG